MGEDYVLEMAIPARLPRGANYCYAAPGTPEISGLTLADGELLGFAVTLGKVGTGITADEFTGEWASLFETYRYYDLTLTTGATVAAGGGEVPPRLRFWPVVPNPAAGPTQLRFSLPEGGRGDATRTTLCIYDVEGRLVRTLLSQELAPGVHELTWDGRDAEGRSAASGVYYARLAAAGEMLSRKVILMW